MCCILVAAGSWAASLTADEADWTGEYGLRKSTKKIQRSPQYGGSSSSSSGYDSGSASSGGNYQQPSGGNKPSTSYLPPQQQPATNGYQNGNGRPSGAANGQSYGNQQQQSNGMIR